MEYGETQNKEQQQTLVCCCLINVIYFEIPVSLDIAVLAALLAGRLQESKIRKYLQGNIWLFSPAAHLI